MERKNSNMRATTAMAYCDVLLKDEAMMAKFRDAFPKFSTELLDGELTEERLEAVSGGILIGLLLPAVRADGPGNGGGLHVTDVGAVSLNATSFRKH